ncbi:MAG: branched-chain amino acid ABC transporter permease [Dehalococcoidia bacterium]
MDLPCGTFNDSYAKDMAIIRTRSQWLMLILLLGFIAVAPFLPFFGGARMLYLMNWIGVTIIAVLGLNILTGYCGQISLGHAAFFGVGAYTTAILVTRFQAAMPGLAGWLAFPLGLLVAGLVAGLVGILFGLPALRVKGLYLALVTIAAQFILYFVFVNWRSVTGGTSGFPGGVPPAQLGPLVLPSDRAYYFVIFALVVIMTFLAKNLVRTRAGRAFIAIRDNDLAAEVMGLNVYYYKMLAFFIACFFAGVAGALWAHYQISVHPDYYDIMQSIWYLGMIIIGGMGSISGAIFGVIFVRALQYGVLLVSPAVSSFFPAVGADVSAPMGQIVFGLIIVLFLIFEPRGLAHRWQLFKASYRLHPFSY